MNAVQWAPLALAELDNICDYLLAEYPSVATRQIDRVLASVEQLRKFSRSGKKSLYRGNRQLAVPGTPYVVFYRLKEGMVEITRVRHGAQRLPKR